MAKVTKILLRPGLFAAPQGWLDATPARLKRWAQKVREMRRLGIRLPIGWGHQPRALPADATQREKNQYSLGALNAGYLDTMDFTPDGRLTGVLDCPGLELDGKGNLTAWTRLPDGREVKTAISEVSLAVKDWTDGQGRLWKDVPVHVALTPLPVFSGQKGFSAPPAGAWAHRAIGGDFSCFSLSTLVGNGNGNGNGKPRIKGTPGVGYPRKLTRATPADPNGSKIARALEVLREAGFDEAADQVAELIAAGWVGVPKAIREQREELERDIEERAARATGREPAPRWPSGAQERNGGRTFELLLGPPDDDDIATPEQPEGDQLSEVLRILEGYGLDLPADTTEDNLAERIVVSGWARYQEKAAEEAEEIQRRAERASARPTRQESWPPKNGQTSSLNDFSGEGNNGPMLMSRADDDRDYSLSGRARRASAHARQKAGGARAASAEEAADIAERARRVSRGGA
jgi:hypothetical protein